MAKQEKETKGKKPQAAPVAKKEPKQKTNPAVEKEVPTAPPPELDMNPQGEESRKDSRGIVLLDRVFKFHSTIQIGKSAIPVEDLGHRGAVGFMLVYETPEQAKNAFPKEETIEL